MRKKFAIKKSYKGNSYKNFPSALGITGVLGFAGFLGFWTYNRQRTLFPFIFLFFLVSLVFILKEKHQMLLKMSYIKKTREKQN